jgi:hypothetical protein
MVSAGAHSADAAFLRFCPAGDCFQRRVYPADFHLHAGQCRQLFRAFASTVYPGFNPPMLRRFSHFSSSISTYLLIKSWLGALTALLQVVLMWILGIDFAVLWGVFSFLFNFVPNIGFYISLIPPTLIALAYFGMGQGPDFCRRLYPDQQLL